MPISLYLARLIGPIFLAIGAGALANARVYKALADEFLRSRALIYLSGLLTLAAGLAIVLAHNLWIADWRVIITILGWLAVIGGVIRIVAPQRIEAIGRRILRHPQALTVSGAVTLVLGGTLSFFGYVR